MLNCAIRVDAKVLFKSRDYGDTKCFMANLQESGLKLALGPFTERIGLLTLGYLETISLHVLFILFLIRILETRFVLIWIRGHETLDGNQNRL